jgi:signal transduction histidine kinase
MNMPGRLLNFRRDMSAWSAWDRRRRIFAVLALVAGVASIFYALTLRFDFFGPKLVTAIDDIGEAVAAAIASGACAWAVSRATGRNRVGWALMGVSAGFWAAGEVVWSIYEVVLGQQVPSPSLADAGFLAAVPFAVAGIRAFWGPAAGTASRWRIWFDGLIVAIALVSTSWGFGLRLVWDSNSNLGTKALALAYPIGDIVIGTVLILAIRRATGGQKGRMALLLTGVACYSIADSAFAYLTVQGTYSSVGSVLNTGWFAGFLLIALAAIYPEAAPRVAAPQARLDLWQLALPWMTLLTAAAGDFFTALSHQDAGLFQPAMTLLLALLLTVNMIIERREFLEMLTEMDTARSTLNRDFKSALTGIQLLSEKVKDADHQYDEGVRVLAADIQDQAKRLDQMVERIL